jgi:hypothetical protein
VLLEALNGDIERATPRATEGALGPSASLSAIDSHVASSHCRMWPAAGRVSSGVAGRARLSHRLARGAAGWPGRAATASRPAGHPASHAEKRAGRLSRENRLADRP